MLLAIKVPPYLLICTKHISLFLYIQAHHQFAAQGTASAIALDLLSLEPNNAVALRYVNPASTSSSHTPGTRSSRLRSRRPVWGSRGRVNPSESDSKLDLSTADGRAVAGKTMAEGYIKLRNEAAILSLEMAAVIGLLPPWRHDETTGVPPGPEMVYNLTLAGNGYLSATTILNCQPRSAREVARDLSDLAPDQQRQFLIDDFEQVISWARSDSNPDLSRNLDDAIRSRLVKRKILLDALLPPSLNAGGVATTETITASALSYVEHHHLSRRYANHETMLGDAVEDIPAANLFVSEDNYAWDMAELASALAANDGVMRNPLTHELFSEADVRRILAHPLGQRLRPMRDAQTAHRSRGVHPDTVRRIAQVAEVMVADQTPDTGPSWRATDEFLAYVATLPDAERDTLDGLKVPGRDSLNGQEFDYTVLQAVKDFRSNVTCGHKVCLPGFPCFLFLSPPLFFISRCANSFGSAQVGDFLKQAARYLGRP